MTSSRIPDFSAVRVLVVGDVMLDRYWYGSAGRISPEAPVPVVRVERVEERAGGAGNVARNVAALGARAQLLGIVGRDGVGEQVQRCLSEEGIDHDLITGDDVTTTTKLRIVSRHQQLIRLDIEQRVPPGAAARLAETFAAHVNTADVVILSDYGKGALVDPRALIEQAHAAGKPVLVDPKHDDLGHYRGADLVTPNHAEYSRMVATAGLRDHGWECAGALMTRHEVGAMIVTLGERGMVVLQPGREPLELPARAREVFDVTGAGDTVIAVLALATAAGDALADAARLANAAAGVVVGKLGAATVDPAELAGALDSGASAAPALLSEPELLRRVCEARARGERIVMTNGCFDLLHAGHVNYLLEAARYSDRLVVALNDDASVARVKGAGRPVHGLEERACVLAALRPVDWVVAFAEDTPERLIEAVRPDFLVKGGDYRADEIAGADSVRRHGGEVIVVPYQDGHSTTATIERIRGRRDRA